MVGPHFISSTEKWPKKKHSLPKRSHPTCGSAPDFWRKILVATALSFKAEKAAEASGGGGGGSGAPPPGAYAQNIVPFTDACPFTSESR